MSADNTLKPNEMIGPYRVVRLLGVGGMGEVYEAFEDSLSRRVALKVISPKALQDTASAQRFRSEGRALARLVHPNVVSVYTLIEQGGREVLAMEYVEGKTLDQFLNETPCGVKELVEIFRKLAEGLGAAHAAGVLHRDLKPQNVIVGNHLAVKLLDFGIAKVHSDKLSVETSADFLIGTLNYMAPEVLNGYPASAQSDIYALGLLFYYMLTGVVPYSAKTNVEVVSQIQTQDLNFSPGMELLLPEDLQNVFRRMIARSLKERFSSVPELLKALAEISLADLPSETLLSSGPRAHIVNLSEIRGLCQEKGFDSSEINLILRLCSDLQVEANASASSDQTMPIERAPTIAVSPETLDKAIDKFERIQSSAASQRIEKTKTQAQRAQAAAYAATRPHVVSLAPSRSFPLVPLAAGTFVTLGAALLIFAFVSKKHVRADVPTSNIVSLAAPEVPAETAAPTVPPMGGVAVVAKRPNPKFEAPLPRAKIGDLYASRIRISVDNRPTFDSIRRFTLSVIEGDAETWTSETNMKIVTMGNPILSPAQVFNGDVGQDYQEGWLGDAKAMFPLAIGKQTTITRVGKNKAGLKWSYDQTCTVMGQSGLQVTAGSFDTFRVHCLGNDLAEDIYYAPGIRHWVYYMSKSTSPTAPKREVLEELLDYALIDQPGVRAPGSAK
jgi:serine/threonine protein kinase